MSGMLLLAVSAYAEIAQIKSKIAEVNTPGKYLKVYHLDPPTDKTEEIRVDVDGGTIFDGGISSLEDLQKDDEVSIEADYNNFTHEWKALSIAPYNSSEAHAGS